MTEGAFAELLRLADRWWKAGTAIGVDVGEHHQRLQSELKRLPLSVRRALVCSLIMEGLADAARGEMPCNVEHLSGLTCSSCGVAS